MSFAVQVTSLLPPYIAKFDGFLAANSKLLGPEGDLLDAVLYSLGGAAKRFRPALVYMVAQALGNRDVSFAALAVECFHTSSLIADDLPCMDDDEMRRGRPCVHKVYGEATALLASFSLISSGFEFISKNATDELGKSVLKQAVESAALMMGSFGIIGGQILDLNPKDSSLETICQIHDLKTVPLFDISLTLGWLFGGGDVALLPKVHKVAHHFGSAFQIVDDIDDYDQDVKISKANNYAVTFGIEAAKKAVADHAKEAVSLFTELGLKGPLTDMSAAFLA